MYFELFLLRLRHIINKVGYAIAFKKLQNKTTKIVENVLIYKYENILYNIESNY